MKQKLLFHLSKVTFTNNINIVDWIFRSLCLGCSSLSLLSLFLLFSTSSSSIWLIQQMQVAKNCKFIQVLQLNGLKQITDASLIQLSYYSHSLLKLQLDSCPQISKE